MSVVSDEVAAAPPPADPASAPRAGSGLFRAFWRWHFYASVLVVPIMLMLATTGLTILYKWQLDPLQHPGVLTVERPAHGSARALSAQEDAVREAYPNATITAVQQGVENRASFFTVKLGADGPTRNVYVDPYSARITGTTDPRHLLSNVATEIHGMIVFGKLSDLKIGTDPFKQLGLTTTSFDKEDSFSLGNLGDRIIELAVCWSLVMTLTGYYLFVRGRSGRLRRVASGAKAAALRNRHASLGAVLGVGFLMLILSGLPWTGVWGRVAQNVATGQGSNLWGDDPGASSDPTLAEKLLAAGSKSGPTPWAEGAAPVPTSTGGGPATGTGTGTGSGHAGHTVGGGGLAGSGAPGSVNIDGVVAAARADGLAEPFYITYPDAPDGVFSVLADQWHDKANPAFTDVGLERTAHVDQYSGEIVGRYGYGDYSVTAKTVSQGIALHEGRRMGSFNLVVTTAFCLGVIFLCVSGPLMWWKRRPSGGGFAAPRGRLPVRARPWLAVVLVGLGVFLPLFGLSLLVVLAFDLLVVRRVPAVAERLNSA